MQSLVRVTCTAVLVPLAVGCGEQTAEDDREAAVAVGCGNVEQPLAESEDFTPWAARISHRPFADVLSLKPVAPGASRPAFAPTEVADLPLVGQSVDGTTLTLGFDDRNDPSDSRSDFLDSGGVLVDIYPDESGGAVVDALASDPDTGHRVVIVKLGENRGALSWSDPDENGVRPHHLLWVDGGRIFSVRAVRPPEVLVKAARQLVC